MIKTTLKIDGMMCGMCEAHMNDVIRKNFKVKKVTSSAKKAIKDIGYEMLSATSEPYEKKGLFHFGK